MHNIYFNFGALMAAKWFADKKKQSLPQNKDQVLKSRRMEDEIYRQNRQDNPVLQGIQHNYQQQLPVIENLLRDVFQSLYSLDIRHNEQSELSPLVRRFNRYILGEVMKSPDFPAMKSICEGRGYPSMEAASEFMEQVSSRLDELLTAANGDKKSLDALQVQEQRYEQQLQDFQKQALGNEQQSTPESQQKLLRTANRLHSKEQQLECLNQMVKDNLAKSKPAREILSQAIAAACDKAEEVQNILRAWGDDAGESEISELSRELVDKVRQNPTLLEIARYLGRLKELIRQKRKNAFAYGRGEKYTLELGNNLKRVISSELALLATPETAPLFVRKMQRKGLKQYARRERISKGQGDIIVCLDESSSTIGENAAWGKAVAYALLEIAAINGRGFALIHFSGRDSCQTDLFHHRKYTQDDVFRSAQVFLRGGTNYETPLSEATHLMNNKSWRKADVVFITDGECELSTKFAEQFAVAKAAMGFTVTGVLMDQDDPGMAFSLKPFCDEIIKISEVGGERAANQLVGSRA